MGRIRDAEALGTLEGDPAAAALRGPGGAAAKPAVARPTGRDRSDWCFAEMAFPQSMFDDDGIRGYVAHASDEAVATATSIQLGSVLGIYNVATVPTRRRSGYGAAVTWRAIEDAAPGTSAVVLQSSPQGFPVYERMGFRTVVEYREFSSAE